MMKRKFAGVLVAVAALHSSVSLALGLGNMTVHSSLNQPLSADIKLVDVGDLNPDQIRVSLASTDDFERAGIDRVFFLNNLHFDVVSSHGKYVIKVTTDKLVREPYLDFLLQVSWPSGRILRDYTVLVDLPDSAAAALASQPKAATTAHRESRSESARQTPVAAASAGAPESVGGDKVRVQRNDTLWRLSERVKPGDATVQQTMLALQQANPRAFLRKNINGLQAGRVLRVPSEDEIHAVSRQQAVHEVARQNDAWAKGVAETGKRQLEGGKQDTATSAAAPSDSGYLRLASGGDGTGGNGGGSKSSDSTAALSQQLTAAQENLDSAKRENTELNSRVSDLQKQVDTLKKLVELKDSELATLQAQVAKRDKSGQGAPAQGASDAGSTAAAGTSAPASAPGQGSEDTGAAASAGVGAAAKTATKQPPEVTVQEPPQPQGLVDKLSSNPLYGGLAAALVALLGFGWWYSRRNRAAGFDEDNDFLDTYEGEATGDAEAAEALLAGAAAGEQADDSAASEAAQAVGDTDETRPSTGDAVSEAEVYRSYGRDDESRALLVTALQSEPERSDVRLKLMEYQVGDGDRDGFRDQYRVLMEQRDHTGLAAAAALLAAGAVAGDWLEGLASDHGDVAAAQPEQTVATEAPVEAEAGIEAADDADEALDLDFDLDLDASSDDLDATRPRQALDFDSDFETALDGETDAADTGDSEVGIDFSLDDGAPEADLEAATSETAESANSTESADSTESVASGDNEALEFDLSDLDLDIGDEPSELSADDIDMDLSAEIEQSSEDQADDGVVDVAQVDSDLTGERAVADDATAEREAIDLDLDDTAATEEVAAGQPEAADFDLGDLDLDDLDATAEAGAGVAEEAGAPRETSAADIEVDTDAAMRDLDSMLQGDDDDELEVLGDADEVATKLDLARAYIDMGDVDGAREILDEVLAEGSDDQKEEANSLLANMTG